MFSLDLISEVIRLRFLRKILKKKNHGRIVKYSMNKDTGFQMLLVQGICGV